MSREGALIEQRGSPFERGLQHGWALAGLIARVVEDLCPAGWDADPAIARRLERELDSLVRYAGSAHLEEMVGIALGSGVPFEAIARLNLVLGSDGVPGVTSPEGMYRRACTALACVDPLLGAVCGKNGDAEAHQAAYYWVRRVDSGSVRFLDVTWPGTIWTDSGINEHGLAMVQTGGPGLLGQGPGLAGCCLPRVVLEQATSVATAIEVLQSVPASGFGLSYVLADADGETAIVEKVHRRAKARGRNRFAWAVNRFELEEMQPGLVPIPLAGLDKSNEARAARLCALSGREPASRAELGSLLRAAPLFQQGLGGLWSVSTAVYTASERSLLVADDDPASGWRRLDVVSESCVAPA
jgi:hypothetical protein